ncbi:MAG TPA: DNA polymerase [Ferrovaceae bacterium]|jgi:DNA polymerase|nr:DNA polymerase [Ferrovaceae bacterium]
MKNKVLVIDFETRWSSKDYTLSKLTTEEYIRDERFKAFGLGFKELGDDKIHWISGDNIQAFVDTVDWRHTAVLAHNAQFDVAILSWVFGARPRFIFDTLSMARALRGIEVGNSLMRLASEFNLPPKGNAVHSTDGMTDLPQDVELELAEYCKHDVFLCEEIFKRLVDGYPKDELYLIDMTLKMYTDPKLELDGEMLNKALTEENKRIADLLSRLNVAEEDLASDAKFANLLQQLGVEAPTKVSKKTGKTAYAFAKNDALFQALVDSDNEDIALLCEARLRVKSTIMRTRAQRFLDISKRGRLPVPLHYYGAHTGRWSAARGSGINLQNLKRKSSLRNAICAPEGYTVVVSDLSQIEPRVLAWLADYQTVLELFRGSADVYAAFGAKMFGVPNMTKESHPDLRQSAKSALLGCGYGMGWLSFGSQLLTGFLGAPPVLYDKKFAKQLGIGKDEVKKFFENEDNVEKALAIPRRCTDAEIITHCVAAKHIINAYRKEADEVKQLWRLCDDMLYECLDGGDTYEFQCIQFRKGEIVLPNSMALRYPNLKAIKGEDKRTEWVYGETGKKIYGSKIVENIVQALARIVMTDAMLRINKRYQIVLTVHDELVAVVPDQELEEAKDWIHAQMIMESAYMPSLPLGAETESGKRYGEAK